MFSWNTIKRPILALAPMAGYTDSSYRQLVKELCPRVICFTEFTSVDGILHGNEATMRQIFFNPEKERPIVAQIFGKKPENFYKAARVLAQLDVDAIDINMGCPAKKIVSSDHGSALLKNQALSQEIVRATVEGASNAARELGKSPCPVSAKMRIGTSCFDGDYFFRFARSLQESGIELITIHGRTSKQMYSGSADWQPIYELKKILSIPVIGNGDVHSGADAVSKIGNLDGVMVGRATFGNPWVMCDIAAAFDARDESKDISSYPPPTLLQKLPWIKRHTLLACEFKGEKWGILEMRKHFAWYIRGVPNASYVRQQLLQVTTQEEAFSILEMFLLKASATAPAVSAPMQRELAVCTV